MTEPKTDLATVERVYRQVWIINELEKQIPGITIEDVCFCGRYVFYVRTPNPRSSLKVIFYPGQNTFDVETIHTEWELIKTIVAERGAITGILAPAT